MPTLPSGIEIPPRQSENDCCSRPLMEPACAQCARQLQALLEALPAMTFIKDDSLRYIFVDESYAASILRKGSEIIAKTDHDLFPGDIAERFEELDRQALDTGAIVESHDRLPSDHGSVRVHTIRSPVWNAESKATSLLCVLISEPRPASVGDPAPREVTQVAHELRTPLAAIKEAVSLLVDEVAGKLTPKQREFAALADRNCVRLERLLEDAIQLERLSAGPDSLALREMPLWPLVTKSTAKALQRSPGASVTLGAGDGSLHARVDPDILQRLVAGLIVLASRCSSSRAVVVDLRRIGAQAEIIVNADGDIASLFEPQAPIGINHAFVRRAAGCLKAALGVRLDGPAKGIYVGLPVSDDSGRGEN